MNKVVVYDIDGTLIDTKDEFVPKADFYLEMPNEDSKNIKYSVFKRPYLDEFLEHCDQIFDEKIVWSAGEKKYVDLIVKNIFKKPPSLVWTKNNCENIFNIDYKYPIIKPLRKLLKDNDSRGFDNLFIIDDTKETARKNKYNFINIKSFTYGSSDDELKKLMKFFDENVNEQDVRIMCNKYNNSL